MTEPKLRRTSGWGTIYMVGIFMIAVSFCDAGIAKASSGTDLVIMLDMSMDATESGSANLPSQNIIDTLAGGARVAAMELEAGDHVSLMTFSENTKTILSMTDDIGKFESALRKTGAWVVQSKRHHLYDSLLAALNSFSEIAQSDRRRCIVVVTTTSDIGSRHTADDVAVAAKSKGAAIFFALISPIPSPSHIFEGRVYPGGPDTNENEDKKMLDPLAWRTGGDVRIYEQSPYVIAKAIGDMVHK